MSKQIKKRKRTPQKSRVKRSPLKLVNLFIIILSVILLAIITNTFLNDSDTEKKITQNTPQIVKNTQEKLPEIIEHDKFEEKTKALEIEYVDINSEHITKKKKEKEIPYQFTYDENNTTKEKINYEQISEIPSSPIVSTTTQNINTESNQKVKKPQLVLIIDDVSSKGQLKAINNIGIPITMAFLPPTKGHKNSAKIAQDLDVYMVHLPLEASNKSFEEEHTLHIGDSLETIEKRIKTIKQYYPNTKYLNNHTGSRFTSDYNSMDKLFSVLKKYNYIFIDSKTTANSVTKQVAKKHNMPYISRNIFLDNKHETRYIQNQLKKAIKIAKKTGLAIAIGHPHKITIETLKNSKYLLDGVELIQINQIKL